MRTAESATSLPGIRQRLLRKLGTSLARGNIQAKNHDGLAWRLKLLSKEYRDVVCALVRHCEVRLSISVEVSDRDRARGNGLVAACRAERWRRCIGRRRIQEDPHRIRVEICNGKIGLAVSVEVSRCNRLRIYSCRKVDLRGEARSLSIRDRRVEQDREGVRISARDREIGFAVPVEVGD